MWSQTVSENIHLLGQRAPAHRAALMDALLGLAAPAEEQTLLLTAVAGALIDRFAAAASDDDWRALRAWAEATCKRNARPNVRRLFTSFSTAFSQVFDCEIPELIAPPATAETAPSLEAVDEIDVLCADMLDRIEMNDPKTAEHCRAVSAWCARIARRMSLNRREISMVARGGLVHDVGKSKTPLEILNAPRNLSDDEMNVMRAHAVIGHEIVSSYPKLADLGVMVRSHHERFDGRGYPDQLDRSRIPVYVRIVSVADTFNAMIGRRPYRAPFSPSRAIAELQRAAGTQLDPDVVGALLDVVARKEAA
jgi:putative nucleotidyltransferase with HDIG domain